MWENPIEIIQTDIQYKVVDEYEKQILKAIQSYGISVNKKELVKALNYDRNQYEKGYADAKAEHRWIPCSERLPDVRHNVLITDGYHTAEGELLDNGAWRQYRWTVLRKHEEVIAWQPLPDPYMESEE